MKTKINITDSFWTRYIQLIRHEMIPYQWNVLHDKENITIDKERDDDYIPSERSHAIENLKIAAGQSKGNHYGWLFQDSDVYKWLESAANAYAIKPDEKLKSMMNEIVELIQDAQDEDGYLSTFYQIEAPELKFRRLFESHELYCAGHLIEAAVAYFNATGDERLIHVVQKLVTCIQDHFGSEKGKITGADGHQEIELALVKLYEATKDSQYLELSQWFLEIRGQDPDFYQKQLKENKEEGVDDRHPQKINTVYHQAHKPIYEQDEAVGHAVRMVYMAAAMAEVAYYKKNERMLEAARRIWENIVKKRLYITGGIGSTVHGEAFTFDYDLPNDTMYCETCAAIGLMFFAKAMLKNEADAEYADIMERALYNSVISGMALDGKHFFYVNPLEVDPTSSQKDPGKSHVKSTRPSWFGCACCPPNLARTLTSLDDYVYSYMDDTVFINLYFDQEGYVNAGNKQMTIKQDVDLAEEGTVLLSVNFEGKPVKIGLRKPFWSKNVQLKYSEAAVQIDEKNGYILLELSESTDLTLSFDLPIFYNQAHPKVKDDVGKVAVQRGPFVYCMEEEDNGKDLHLLRLSGEIKSVLSSNEEIGEVIVLKAEGEKQISGNEWEDTLYRTYKKPQFEKKELTFIPYHLWANRCLGEMRVWVNVKEES